MGSTSMKKANRNETKSPPVIRSLMIKKPPDNTMAAPAMAPIISSTGVE